MQQQAVTRLNAEKTRLSQAVILVDNAVNSLERGDVGGALPVLRQAIELAPSLAEAHFQLAVALTRSAAPERTSSENGGRAAIENALLRVIELEPANAHAYARLGLLHANHGHTAPAFAALRRAVSLAPSLADAQRALAELARAHQDWPTAIAALEAVIVWQPDDASSLASLAGALIVQRDCTGAAAVFARARRLKPSIAAAEHALASALEDCRR